MTSLRHLLARAVAVEQRVRRAVEARQRVDPDPDDAFRGLYLTEENVARLLDEEEPGRSRLLTSSWWPTLRIPGSPPWRRSSA